MIDEVEKVWPGATKEFIKFCKKHSLTQDRQVKYKLIYVYMFGRWHCLGTMNWFQKLLYKCYTAWYCTVGVCHGN